MRTTTADYRTQLDSSFENLVTLIRTTKEVRDDSSLKKAYRILVDADPVLSSENIQRINSSLEVAMLAVEEIGLGQTSVLSILLTSALRQGRISQADLEKEFGGPEHIIVRGLNSINELNEKTIASQAENFRNLLLNLAGDVRVILIKIAEHLYFMRNMKQRPQEYQIRLASEASYLYAPLAHRLGFYLIK